MKLQMVIELDYDADLMHGEDPSAKECFFEELHRQDGALLLHSQEIGDTIGTVRVLEILDDPDVVIITKEGPEVVVPNP